MFHNVLLILFLLLAHSEKHALLIMLELIDQVEIQVVAIFPLSG